MPCVAARARVGAPPRRPRQKAPTIDIDAQIYAAAQQIRAASIAMSAAKRMARNEKRKKQRLSKKAQGLSVEDLERLAVIKRCGLWDPANGTTFNFKKQKTAAQEDEPAARSPADELAQTSTSASSGSPVHSAAPAPEEEPAEEDHQSPATDASANEE